MEDESRDAYTWWLLSSGGSFFCATDNISKECPIFRNNNVVLFSEIIEEAGFSINTLATFRPIEWIDDRIRLIDQTLLPNEEQWIELRTYQEAISSIKEMRIRGAPAIGIAGAYAVALAAKEFSDQPFDSFKASLIDAADEIANARPTGANLAWAVKRTISKISKSTTTEDAFSRILAEAKAIHEKDVSDNIRMGRFGANLIPSGSRVMTHCNAGALATGGFGTALGVITTAWDDGNIIEVIANETRPFLQGARLTAWELVQGGITARLSPDSAAGQLMRSGMIQAIVVGADRIAANGDVANKIGTYSVAVLAKENGVPFYVAAPISTIDMSLKSGDDIEIEERPASEVTHIAGTRIVPKGIGIINTAFDVTPNEYVTAIVTECGVVRKPFDESLRIVTEPSIG